MIYAWRQENGLLRICLINEVHQNTKTHATLIEYVKRVDHPKKSAAKLHLFHPLILKGRVCVILPSFCFQKNKS